MTEKLIQGAEKLSLNLSAGQLESLETYIQCVLDFNKSYNLMKADSADELAVNHVLDSLAGVKTLSSLMEALTSAGADTPLSICDVGSGGGCPGIPLSVAFPQASFTLIERMEKRCDFLNDAISRMKLTNVKVCCAQANTVPKANFDIAVFRAFHPFDPKITKLLMGLIKKDGYLMAYKAREEKIKAEMEAVSFMIPHYQRIPITVPFLEDHERNLVVVKKD